MNIVRFDLSKAQRISIDEAKKKFDEDKNVIFLDVRSRGEFEKAHIPGAVAMPFKELPQRLGELSRDALIIPY